MAIATRQARSELANLVRACTAEAVGTFLLVLVGTAVVIAATQGKGTAGPAYKLSFGLILVPIVASLGRVSGAHVNPAVTLGLAVAGRFPWKVVPAYFVAQVLGAVTCSSLPRLSSEATTAAVVGASWARS